MEKVLGQIARLLKISEKTVTRTLDKAYKKAGRIVGEMKKREAACVA